MRFSIVFTESSSLAVNGKNQTVPKSRLHQLVRCSSVSGFDGGLRHLDVVTFTLEKRVSAIVSPAKRLSSQRLFRRPEFGRSPGFVSLLPRECCRCKVMPRSVS